MKNLLIILLLLSFYSSSTQATTYKVLFLGNSYTASNNLASKVAGIAESLGHELITDTNTPGGYTLEGHSTNMTSLDKINSDDWDFVVLQEQSQIPSFPQTQVEEICYPFAAELNELIRTNNACTKTLFFMTWGRENGDANNCDFFPPLCTYEGMQDQLSASYLEMANRNNASVAPVGEAWRTCREVTNDEIGLYTGDGSHPSASGTYLAACVFFASIFQESPVSSDFLGGVDADDAALIQQIAADEVLTELSDWYITDPAPLSIADYPCTVVKGEILLEGAYNNTTGLMSTLLLDNDLLPKIQPFVGALANFDNAILSTFRPSTVDWVLLEARATDDPSIIIEQRAALVLSDGTLADINGITNGVSFRHLTVGEEYYLSVKSRNHLGLLSATSFDFSSSPSYDFTNAANLWSGEAYAKLLATDVYGMYVGDLNDDGAVTVADYNSYVLDASAIEEYLAGDLNMDGIMSVADFNKYISNASKIGLMGILY